MELNKIDWLFGIRWYGKRLDIFCTVFFFTIFQCEKLQGKFTLITGSYRYQRLPSIFFDTYIAASVSLGQEGNL